MPRIFALCLLLLTLLCPSTSALAHRVHLFAYVQQGEIVVDSRFSKSKPVQQGRIEIFEASSGKLLLHGESDAQGISRFTIPPELLAKPVDLRLVLKAGEGHQTQWLLPAGELNPQGNQAAEEAAEHTPTAVPATQSAASENPPSHLITSEQELEAVINRALAAHLQPIQAMLAAEQAKGPGLNEIIGGIGWIIGIFALIFAIKEHKKKN